MKTAFSNHVTTNIGHSAGEWAGTGCYACAFCPSNKNFNCVVVSKFWRESHANCDSCAWERGRSDDWSRGCVDLVDHGGRSEGWHFVVNYLDSWFFLSSSRICHINREGSSISTCWQSIGVDLVSPDWCRGITNQHISNLRGISFSKFDINLKSSSSLPFTDLEEYS